MSVLESLLERARAAEAGGLVQSALALYQRAVKNAWGSGTPCPEAKEAIKRLGRAK